MATLFFFASLSHIRNTDGRTKWERESFNCHSQHLLNDGNLVRVTLFERVQQKI